jgi:hypothetical protein
MVFVRGQRPDPVDPPESLFVIYGRAYAKNTVALLRTWRDTQKPREREKALLWSWPLLKPVPHAMEKPSPLKPTNRFDVYPPPRARGRSCVAVLPGTPAERGACVDSAISAKPCRR